MSMSGSLTRTSTSLIERFTPAARHTGPELLSMYPPRQLQERARVTRVAPSPTGYMHIGAVYAALISHRVAHQTGGVFFLRIEDTDREREVEGATELIVTSLERYGLTPDEGEQAPGVEVGAYGPYRQSRRMPIYHTWVRELLRARKAYPCFATPAELEGIHEAQAREKASPGYYGRWAVWRNRPQADIEQALDRALPFVIRLRAGGEHSGRIIVDDCVRGELSLPENDNDIVLLKSDGVPTYHLAHAVDDHLMRTTDVIRGHEWLGSLPIHAQLFEYFGWPAPRYSHISPIEKTDGASRRKLSKRSDPEASVTFYDEAGYPPDALVEYLLNLADSRFEDWRIANPQAPSTDFQLDITRLNRSGALADLQKITSVSKDVIARVSVDEIYRQGAAWAMRHNPQLSAAMQADPDYARGVLAIGRTPGHVRKDIAKWSDLAFEVGYFFDPLFADIRRDVPALLETVPTANMPALIADVVAGYDDARSKDDWLAWMRAIVSRHGYAENAKEFKKRPSLYKGHFGDVAAVFRILLTGRKQAPDLHEIMHAMGADRIKHRLSAIAAAA
jgi:glutamyl-tRNA synthetase